MRVKPHFEHASPRTDAELDELLNLEIELALTSDAPWVVTPASMVLTSGAERGGQTFTIRLDLSSLPSGAVSLCPCLEDPVSRRRLITARSTRGPRSTTLVYSRSMRLTGIAGRSSPCP